MKLYKAICSALLAGLTSVICLPAAADTQLVVSHAWVREAPPGAGVQAGYMEIHNTSSKTIKITAIESPNFTSVEMHRMFNHNGMMRMQQQDTLNIPANSMLELKPGGYHLMLRNPASYLKSGDTVQFTLTTTANKHINVKASVKTDNGS